MSTFENAHVLLPVLKAPLGEVIGSMSDASNAFLGFESFSVKGFELP